MRLNAVLQFQFHKGTIKTDTVLFEHSPSAQISIP